jgi:hypothetical protein
MTTTTSSAKELKSAYVDADAAAAQAAAAGERLAALERAAAEKRKALRCNVFAAWLSRYDRPTLRRAVIEAQRRFEADPSTGTEIGVIRAARRELAHHGFASECVEVHGCPPPPGGIPNTFAGEALDGGGNPLPSNLGDLFAAGSPSRRLVEKALAGIDAEIQAVRDDAERQAATVAVRAPTGYRVTVAGRTGEDWDDTIGGCGIVAFRNGVAFVMVDAVGDARVAALVRYWRSLPEAYEVTEVYGSIPPGHVEALRRVA